MLINQLTERVIKETGLRGEEIAWELGKTYTVYHTQTGAVIAEYKPQTGNLVYNSWENALSPSESRLIHLLEDLIRYINSDSGDEEYIWGRLYELLEKVYYATEDQIDRLIDQDEFYVYETPGELKRYIDQYFGRA